MFIKLCVLLCCCHLISIGNCLKYGEEYRTFWSQSSLVRPVVYHTRNKREIPSTRQESGTHQDEVLIRLDVEGDSYTLELRLNHDLLPDGHTISYQEGGKTVLHKPRKEELDLCQYSGHIRGKPNSWVALSTCFGLRGAINDGSSTRYIEPAEGSDLQSLHYIYEDNDVETGHCGHDDDQVAKSDKLLMESTGNDSILSRHKRDASFQLPYKADETSRFVELVLVVDHGLYLDADRDIRTLHHQLQEIINIMNAMYSPLNIFIVMTSVEVWTEGDRIDVHPDIGKTLSRFKEYRQKHLFRNIGPHDHAQLLSKIKFDSSILGFAYVSSMCSYEFSCGVLHPSVYSADYGIISGKQLTFSAAAMGKTAQTMAHELGHSFGMHHDNDPHIKDCICRYKSCIMGSSYTDTTRIWSECSLRALYDGFSKGLDYCLRNKPSRLLVSPSCGNGFVEPGEECDCGSTMKGFETYECDRCCNPKTCRLRDEAKCATGACCDLQTCQIKSTGAPCRGARDVCDLPEYCTGDSEFCPEDVFVMDTTPCSSKAYCMKGQCRTHDSQCQTLWGSTGRNAHHDCYMENTKGNFKSNCGYDVLQNKYTPCSSGDALCGRLNCLQNGNIQIGDNQRTFLESTTINKHGVSFECHMVRIDFGLGDVDPGLVPDGAACGDDQMCFQQQCLPLAYLRMNIVPQLSQGCLANCSGNGVCNSKGYCHCNEGFVPPLCVAPSARKGRTDTTNSTLPAPEYPDRRDNTRHESNTPRSPATTDFWDRSGYKPPARNHGNHNTRAGAPKPGGTNQDGRSGRNPSSTNYKPGSRKPSGTSATVPVGTSNARPGTRNPNGINRTPPGARNPSGRNPVPPRARNPSDTSHISPGARNPYGRKPTPPRVRNPIGRKPTPPGVRNPGDGNITPPGESNPGDRNRVLPGESNPSSENHALPGARNPSRTNYTTPGATKSSNANDTWHDTEIRNGTKINGPAERNHNDKTFKLVIYIIFLGVCPLIVLILLLYLMKRKSLPCKLNRICQTTSLIDITTLIRTKIISLFNKNKANNLNEHTAYTRNVENSVQVIASDVQNFHDPQNEVEPISTPSRSNVNNRIHIKRFKSQEPMKRISKGDIKLLHDNTNLPKEVTNDIYSLYSKSFKRHDDKIKSGGVVASTTVNSVQANDALQKKPIVGIYANVVPETRNLYENINDVKHFDTVKPISNSKPATIYLLHTEYVQPVSNEEGVVANNETKLNSHESHESEKNELRVGSKDVETVKKYEGYDKRYMNPKLDSNNSIYSIISKRPTENIANVELTSTRTGTVKDTKSTTRLDIKQNALPFTKSNKPVPKPKPQTFKLAETTIAKRSANVDNINYKPTQVRRLNKVKPMPNPKPAALHLATNAIKHNPEDRNHVEKAEQKIFTINKAKPPTNAKPATLLNSNTNPYNMA